MVSLRPHSQVFPLCVNILYLVFNVDVSTTDLDRVFHFFEYVWVMMSKQKSEYVVVDWGTWGIDVQLSTKIVIKDQLGII